MYCQFQLVKNWPNGRVQAHRSVQLGAAWLGVTSGDAGTDQCHRISVVRRYVYEAVGHLHLPVHAVLDHQLIVDNLYSQGGIRLVI
jgi:hypothetical protein